MNKLKRILPILAALVLALLLEVFAFNWRSVFSLGGEWTPLPEPAVTDDLASQKNVNLTFKSLYRDIRWCHIDIEVRDGAGNPVPTRFDVSLSDEGSHKAYKAGSVLYYPGYDRAAWFPLHSYGQVRYLTVSVQADREGCTWRLREASVNGSVPFRISVPRTFGLFALFFLLWALRPGSVVWDNRSWNRRRWAKILCVVLILALNLFGLLKLTLSNQSMNHIPDDPWWEHHLQYAKLARAFTEGRLWIEEPGQEKALEMLSGMKDPYDTSARLGLFAENGMTAPWDTAFYDGHLYVYFGVVPVVLTYLPWCLLAGRDLPTVWAVILSGAAALGGAFLLMRVLVRSRFPKTPFPAYVLLSLLLGNCTGVLSFAVHPSFYIVPIHFSLAFVHFALALWFSADLRWTGPSELCPADETDALCFTRLLPAAGGHGVSLRIAAGSLCAALTAGCRPQFLVFSVLALPLFLPKLREEKDRSVLLRRILAFALPYAAVAVLLMLYNHARFGSPFDFGANYNLTTNDMRLRGFEPGRLPDGFFTYLFQLPNLQPFFPYWTEAPFTPLYVGKTISEPMFGGALVTFPFLWFLAGLRRAAPVLREKKLFRTAVLPLPLALAVVAADTEMAGILWRYTNDYLPLLFLSAAFVFPALLQGTGEEKGRKRLFALLTAAAVLTFFACLMIGIVNAKLPERSVETYYALRDLLSIP